MINYEKELNKEQCEAATSIDGPLLILAGAGTGKTRTLTYRAAYMLEHGIEDKNILMLTFTNKAANEMKTRIRGLCGENTNITACTFHSFCAIVLRRYGEKIGISPSFVILGSGDDEDIISIMKSGEDKEKYKGKGFPPSRYICDAISAAINKHKKVRDIISGSNYECFEREIVELGKKARAYKAENNLLNYDDILVQTIKLLSECPEITKRVAEIYTHIMVDEYQDTNFLQEAILLRLFEYTKNIAVVGDDMQSLYAFRGAEIGNILHFRERFEGAKLVKLTLNYRSCQEILDFSNKMCEYQNAYMKTSELSDFAKHLTGTHHSSKLPTLLSVGDQEEECKEAYNIIVSTIDKGTSPSEICVIERNAVLSARLEIMLNRSHIEFDKYGGEKFFEKKHIKDILAYLRIMLNPYDEISWFRVLQLHPGIGNIYARKIAEKCKTEGSQYLSFNEYKKRKFYNELLILQNEIDGNNGKNVELLVSEFVDFYVDLQNRVITEMETDEDNRESLYVSLDSMKEDFDQLIDIAKDYKKLSTFLDDMLLDNSGNEESSTNHVIISTVHSAKGLEFDTVIVLDAIDEIFPKADEVGSDEDLEELRCMYVAITRAKENLFIFCPKYATRFNKPINGVPARYFEKTENYVRTNDSGFFSRFGKNLNKRGYDWDWC